MIGTRISHYRILSELGHGGMGIVYKAQDDNLRRFVAIKVLRSEYLDSPEIRSRFLREARMAAVVEHPYIATIFEAGQQDDILYIAMEYVEGSTLRTRLHHRNLSTREVLHHAIEVAEGLATAHQARVIHRDLKPENVMISRVGHAKILDFGLAKLLEKRDEATSSLLETTSNASTELTERYTRLGTPSYMSPEQVRATEIDHRSDLFSFGTLLFESFTHEPLFTRDNQADTLAAILRDPVPSVSQYNIEAPDKLDWILQKCLAKDPEQRYQDTLDLVVDLDLLRNEWEHGTTPVGGYNTPDSETAPMLLREATEDPQRTTPTPDPSPSPSPTPQPKPPWPASIRITLRIVLSVVFLAVSAYYARMYWPKPTPDNASVFYQRGMHYLREESENIRSLANAINMFYRSIDADSTSAVSWAALSEAYGDRFHQSRAPADLQESENALQRAIALGPAVPEVLNAEGHNLLTKKRYEEAKVVLQRAIDANPNLDVAWANIGRAHRELREYKEGLNAIETAIRLNPQSFRHHISLGNFYRAFGEMEKAAEAYRQALALKPNSSFAANNLGSALLVTSDFPAAAEAFRKALAVNDEYGTAWSNLGTAYFFMQDYGEAERSYRRALELEPDQVVHYINLADALVMLGRQAECPPLYARASQLVRQEVEEKPEDPEARIRLGVLCARAGDRECALEASRRAEELKPGNQHILFRSATIHAILGRRRDALDRLESAVKFGLKKAEIENDPDLRALHNEPRYGRILDLAG